MILIDVQKPEADKKSVPGLFALKASQNLLIVGKVDSRMVTGNPERYLLKYLGLNIKEETMILFPFVRNISRYSKLLQMINNLLFPTLCHLIS